MSGVQELHLYVTGAPDVIGGAANWADAKLVDKDERSTWLGETRSLDVIEGRFSIDSTLESGVSGPIKIAGRQFEHGLHVYAYSKLRVALGGKYERFEASIGIDEWVGKIGAVRFIVTDERGAARLDLWPLVSRDFPTGQPQREIRWEQQDGILDQDWTADDWQELASRYAQACRHLTPLERTALASHVPTPGASIGSGECITSREHRRSGRPRREARLHRLASGDHRPARYVWDEVPGGSGVPRTAG